MTVIELGDVSPVADEPGPAARPEFNPRSVRRFAAIGVALICALVFGASARPGTPAVHEVWSTPITSNDAMTVRADGLFLHRSAEGRPEITAYEVATGAIRWTRRIEAPVSWGYQGEQAGVLLIPGGEKFADIEFDDGGFGQIAYGGSTTALDSATGRWLWRVSGEVQFVTAESVLLAERDSAGDFTSMRLVGAHDGADLWMRELPRRRHLSVQGEGDGPPRIVIADDEGATTALRYSDGAVLAERTLNWPPAEPEIGIDTYLYTVAGILMVHRNDPSQGSVTAYDAGTLERLWSLDTRPYPAAQYCGPVICLSEGGRMLGLEPRTGQVRWTLPTGSGTQMINDHRMLISADSGDPPEQFLIDPATGVRIGGAGRGWLLRADPADDRLVVLSRVYEPGALRTSVRHVDLATGRDTVIGEVTATEQIGGPQCDSAVGYLACTRDQQLVVTTVR